MQQTGGLSGLSGRNGIRKGGYGGVVTASCCRFHACPARSSLADLTLPLAQVPEHTGHQAMQWKGSETLSWQSGLGPGCVVFGEALPLPKPWVLHLQNGRVWGGERTLSSLVRTAPLWHHRPRCGLGCAPSEGSGKASSQGSGKASTPCRCSTLMGPVHLAVLSPCIGPHCLLGGSSSVSKFLPFIRTPVIWGMGPILMASAQLHHLCEDPISKRGHTLRYGKLGLQLIFCGDQNSIHDSPPNL